jgi:3-oxoacyl-[acyl-carrier protein] reductase
MDIRDKVAVVTGAASGIGQAVAVELAGRGVKALALVDRCDTVTQVASEIAHSNGRDI